MKPPFPSQVEAHVAAANARDDGEDQVYLKVANEEAYVAAFGETGQVLVTLKDSSIGADQLARDARHRGAVARRGRYDLR